MPVPTARDRFFAHLKTEFYEGSFAELVLEKYQGLDRRMRALCVRQTSFLPGKQVIEFVYVHESHQTEKSFSIHEALEELQTLVGKTFLEAHLVCAAKTYHLTFTLKGTGNLKVTPNSEIPSRTDHAPTQEESAPEPDATVSTAIPWNRALEAGAKKAGITHVATFPSAFINEFLAWFTPLLEYAVRPAKKKPTASSENPITIVQLESGLGQLAFTLATTLGERARVHGIDASAAALDLCNRVAGAEGLINLAFTKPPAPDAAIPEMDVLIALNAHDTDADNALANGVAAGASLIIVEPCAHRELYTKLSAPSIWPEAICEEALIGHQTSSITDTFRAILMACAGYKIKTFSRATAPNAAPNIVIAAIKPRVRTQVVPVETAIEFARIYGIRHQHLAKRFGISLV
ncbi:MAG: class I SAM-dependent methyltransferase [Nibricoccus sp.]